MSDPINEMFPSGGGMRGGPALVCVTYDSNGNPCGISGLPDFAENYVEALVAERDRLAVLSEEWRVECLKQNEALSAALERAEQAEARILAALDLTPDPRVTALVDALALAADRLLRCHIDYPWGSRDHIKVGKWAGDARAALAAFKEGAND